MKENVFPLKRKETDDIFAPTITYVDYADDIALLASTPTKTESLLHNLEQAAGSTGFHVNADKTEYVCLN